ncbi:MAG: sel1 repeat family protein [Akkermansia sp.]|nr:sel1 repeat family protein [Akkermansia sp.]
MSKNVQSVYISAKAREAMAKGVSCERKNDLRGAEVWYLVAVRNKHPRASRSLQRVQSKQERESLTNRDIREMEQRLKESQIVEELPKIASTFSIPREDKAICVQLSVRKEDMGRERQEQQAKMNKPTLAGNSAEKSEAVASASKTAKNQKQEKKKALNEMKQKAGAGDLDAMYGLGMFYVNEGIKWLQQAAKKRHHWAKEQLKRWKNEDEIGNPESISPALTAKKDVEGTMVLTYEQIVEQVERLQPFFQYRLAKICLEAASARGHQHAKRLIGLWGAKEIEPENVAARCMVWGRDVLPLEVNDTHESGHEVVTDALSQSVHLVSERVEEKRSWWVCLVEKWKKWIRW